MRQAAQAAKKAIWILAIVVAVLTTSGAALQASMPVAPAPKPPEFAKTTVHFLLVSIPDRKMALLVNGKAIRIYHVAVGKTSTPSPTGAFKIVNRVPNPTYYHKGQVIPAGKGNPVGTRWMGLSAKGYGIHGTNQPTSIGKAASTGCIRMSKRDLEELFEMVNVGDPVEIRSERDDQNAQLITDEAGTETVAEVSTDDASASE